MNVELIYDADCPNVSAARALLIKAFTQVGVSARWREWERNAVESPEYVRAFGSPTILVDGEDVAGVGPADGLPSCRIYAGDNGDLTRAPPFELICSALRKGASPPPRDGRGIGHWQALVASFPAVGTALLPKLVCPLCLPAYTALLSALGLGFVNYTPYLLPLTMGFLTVAVGFLAIQTRRNGRWIALVIGIAASVVILSGKFLFELAWLTNGGIALLIFAVVIGMRKKAGQAPPCPACAATGSEPQTEAR